VSRSVIVHEYAALVCNRDLSFHRALAGAEEWPGPLVISFCKKIGESLLVLDRNHLEYRSCGLCLRGCYHELEVLKQERGLLRRSLPLGVGVILLLVGGALLYTGGSRFEVRTLGFLACLLGVYMIRKSTLRDSSRYSGAEKLSSSDGPSQRPSKKMWMVGVGLIALVGVSFFFLYEDAIGGYKDVVPVYFFTAAILVTAAFWAYLIARIL